MLFIKPNLSTFSVPQVALDDSALDAVFQTIFLTMEYCTMQGQPNTFSVKDQIVNILGFGGPLLLLCLILVFVFYNVLER